MDLIELIFTFIVVPLYVWVWLTDRKIVKLEAQKVTNEDLEKIYNKLDEIKNNMNDNFVSTNSCDFRHKIKE